jgi:hypothetical protein
LHERNWIKLVKVGCGHGENVKLPVAFKGTVLGGLGCGPLRSGVAKRVGGNKGRANEANPALQRANPPLGKAKASLQGPQKGGASSGGARL